MCCTNRAKKGCSSHRIPEQAVADSVLMSLKEHISTVLEIEKTLEFLAGLPLQRAEVQKADARLVSKQEEIKGMRN